MEMGSGQVIWLCCDCAPSLGTTAYCGTLLLLPELKSKAEGSCVMGPRDPEVQGSLSYELVWVGSEHDTGKNTDPSIRT